MANAPSEVHFRVNLISDQVNTLLRQRAFQQLSVVASVLMVAAGTILALLMTMHLATAIRMRSGTQSKIREIGDLQKICEDLDHQKKRATQRANAIAPLLPIARQRVAWAPKLAAVAAALPPGAGVVSIRASQSDIFVVRASANAKQQNEGGLPQMAIAILCAASEAPSDNLGAFVENLKKDEAFMNKFDSVQLTAMEQDSWASKPVEILHVHAQGTPK
jgi:membrane-associated protease RseP (regulator of RpoE activity)